MSSSTTQYHLDILIDQGTRLFEVLNNIKDKHKTPITPAHSSEEVKDIVRKVLNGLQSAPPDAGLTKESIQKLVEKIESIMEDFIKHDSDYKSVYEKLTQDVCSFNRQKQGSDWVTETSADSADVESSEETVVDSSEPDYGSQDRYITNEERAYLCLFLLFPAGAEIKKREIIHCWIGLSSVNVLDILVVGERTLAKFVEKGLIERTFKNKKLVNRYKMTKGVHYLILKCYTKDFLDLHY